MSENLSIRIMRLIKSQRRNIGDLSWLVAVQLTAAAFGFLTQVKIANTLGRELFGQIAYGTLLGSYGAALIQFGMDLTLTRDLIHYPERTNVLVKASLFLRYFLAVLVVFGVLAWKFSAWGADITWGVFLIAVSFSLFSMDLMPLYDAWKKFRRQSAYFLTQKALYLLLIWVIILLFPNKLSVLWIGITMLGTVVFYLFLQHHWAMQRIESKRVDFHQLAGVVFWLIRQNWIVFIAAIAGVITTRLSQLVLKHFTGFAELGAYAAAWQIVLIVNLFLNQIMRIGKPATARNTKPGTSQAIKIRFLIKYSLIMLTVTIPFCLPMIFMPDIIFNIFFGPEYYPAVQIMPILGVYLMLCSIGAVSAQYVIGARIEKGYLLSVSAGAIISVLACQLLIPMHGIIGAAWALLLSHGSVIILYIVLTIKNVSIGPLAENTNRQSISGNPI